MRMIFTTLLLGTFWSCQASAQLGEAPLPQATAKANEATLEETQRWLEEKISQGGYRRYMAPTSEFYEKNYSRVDIFFKDCDFQFVWTEGRPDEPYEIYVEAGSLASLNGHLRSGHIGIVADKPLTWSRSYSIRAGVPEAQLPAVRIAVRDGDRATIATLADKALKADPVPMTDYFFFMPRTPADPTVVPTFDAVMEQRIFNAFEHASGICRARDLAAREADLAKSGKQPNEPF